MNAQHLRRGLYCIFVFLLPIFAFAQGTPLALGPLTVMVPQGWAAQTNAAPVKLFAPGSTPQQFFEADIFPFEQTQEDLRAHHATVWGRMVALVHPVAQAQSGVLGQFVWTRVEFQGKAGREMMILYSAKVGSTYIPIAVDTNSANLISRSMPAFEAMLNQAVLADSVPATMPTPAGIDNSSSTQQNSGSPATLADYIYTAPQGWASNQYPDGTVLTSQDPVTGERCNLSMWPMRTAGDNLQTDANSAFQDIFKTYELRTQTSRRTPLTPMVIRGTSGQGWDYVILRRGIGHPAGPSGPAAGTVQGFIFVAKLDNRLAVISGISKDSLVSTCMGDVAKNIWPRFFYDLSFKNWTSTDDQSAAMRKRIAGDWINASATAATEITFAANGRYSNGSAHQDYNSISNSEVVATTTGAFGNGSYTLKGNSITLRPDGRQLEAGFIRLEEESKDEGRTWQPFLYLMRTSSVDGKEYEVRFRRK